MIDSEIFSIITLIIILIGLGYVYLTLQDCGVILGRMKENCKSMMKACSRISSDLGELDEIQKDLKRRNKKTKVK